MTEMNDEQVQDPLKALESICLPDSRQKHFAASLAGNHAALDEIRLKNNVPVDVRQLFETAKNLSLYSWFVYRFHQVSELIAYSALEMALKERYRLAYPDKNPPMLKGLLRKMQEDGWVQNDDISNAFETAYRIAQQQKTYAKLEVECAKGNDSVPIQEPTAEEVEAVLESLDFISGFVSAIPELRNELAHGSKMLYPGSIATLDKVSQVINGLFK